MKPNCFLILALLFLLQACTREASDNETHGFEVLKPDVQLLEEMRGKNVFGSHSPVSAERLRLVNVRYFGFDNRLHEGEIMVLDACSQEVKQIFLELFRRRFPIDKVNLITKYEGSDSLSMADNNTSAHNLRQVTGSERLSLHAYGTAIDINPVQNPYVNISCYDSLGIARFHPVQGIDYANRKENRPGKINRKGLAEEVVEVFARHGFYIWGGYWDCPIDYQHFQVSRSVSEVLAVMEPVKAEKFFTIVVDYYNENQRPLEDELQARIGEKVLLQDYYLADPERFDEMIRKLD